MPGTSGSAEARFPRWCETTLWFDLAWTHWYWKLTCHWSTWRPWNSASSSFLPSSGALSASSCSLFSLTFALGLRYAGFFGTLKSKYHHSGWIWCDRAEIFLFERFEFHYRFDGISWDRRLDKFGRNRSCSRFRWMLRLGTRCWWTRRGIRTLHVLLIQLGKDWRLAWACLVEDQAHSGTLPFSIGYRILRKRFGHVCEEN